MLNIELPVGFAMLDYIPPDDAPASGAEWRIERDYPGVRVRVFLPTRTDGVSLREDLISSTAICSQALDPYWGSYDTETDHRVKCPLVIRKPTLLEAETEALVFVAELRPILNTMLDSRAARLAQRRAAIAKAHAERGNIAPPEVECS
jgi:hypothetical protein